jgi:pyruvate formate lyase activating enzyme
MIGREMTAGDVLGEVLKDRIFFDDSGGGVTFSGGEPLAQTEFLGELLRACRRAELHTAVDTCGYAPREDLMAIAPLVDLFLYDLKLMDDGRHAEHTGESNALILDNLRELGHAHGNIWLRIPVVPGINDDEAHLGPAARLAASLPGVRQVNLLPYHRLGTHKASPDAETALPIAAATANQLQTVAEPFLALGLHVETGG